MSDYWAEKAKIYSPETLRAEIERYIAKRCLDLAYELASMSEYIGADSAESVVSQMVSSALWRKVLQEGVH